MLQTETQTVNNNLPEILTVRQAAQRGILPERTLRRLVTQKKIPVICSGRTQYINFTTLIEQLKNGAGSIWE